jgi:hypothetical protein
MTEAQINAAVKVSAIEWVTHWTLERLSGRQEYPDPVFIDEGYRISEGVHLLRDRYEMLRSITPYIPEAKFRWEQVDSWAFDIKLREYPDLLSGGQTRQLNPAWLYETDSLFQCPYAYLELVLVTFVLELICIVGTKRMVIGFVAEVDSRRLWPVILLLEFLLVINYSRAVFKCLVDSWTKAAKVLAITLRIAG